MRKSIPVVALGLSAALVLSACGGGTAKSADKHAADNAAAPDTITAAIGYDGDNYDPATTTSAVATSANWHTVEGLTELSPVTREVEPALAAELPKQIDDVTYEATLRDGAKFSDGTDVTADDVVFAYTRAIEGFYKPMLDFWNPSLRKMTRP